ncbi:MAG TPA: TetR/AcrR family transcriptional regulator [Spirochaetota bacterium]|nr:TetR/AcrR family transcriptional regulator [Spirochaetota bacterium]HPJ38333.1 TetR/AcrR family transcriptional regulator [Spirochaetota bacterium]HPQ52139.1 TetR/AcrR family transcriptional regulator [Spirochaetota bacterium]
MGEKRKNGTQRELILEQSNRLFWDKGYAETSMRDIANACGFRPANIYNFFECKESILFENLLQEMIEIVTPVRHLKDDEEADPVEALRFFIKNHVALTLGEKSSSKLLFDVGLKNLSEPNRKKIIRLRDEYDAIGEAIIRRGIRKGVFAPVDEKIAVFSIASIIARSRIWYSPKGKYKVDDIVDFIFNFTMNGISAEKK